MERRDYDEGLVRCLDCGTVYALQVGQDEAPPCPNCGNVGWVALDRRRRSRTREQ